MKKYDVHIPHMLIYTARRFFFGTGVFVVGPLYQRQTASLANISKVPIVIVLQSPRWAVTDIRSLKSVLVETEIILVVNSQLSSSFRVPT